MDVVARNVTSLSVIESAVGEVIVTTYGGDVHTPFTQVCVPSQGQLGQESMSVDSPEYNVQDLPFVTTEHWPMSVPSEHAVGAIPHPGEPW